MSNVATMMALVLAAVVPPQVFAASPGRLAIAETERHRAVFVAPDGVRRAVAPTGLGPRGFALQGSRLLVADTGTERAPGSTLTAIDAATGIALETIHACDACAPRAVAVDEQGTVWFTATTPPAIVELAGTTRRPLAIENGVPGRIVAVRGSRWIAAGSRGGSLLLVDRTSRRVSLLDVGPSPELLAARPGAAELWVALNPEGRLVVVGLADEAPAIARTANAPAFPQGLAFTPDGSTLLVTGGRERVLALIDAAGGRDVARITFASAPRDVAVAPDGRTAAVFLPAEERVALVDIGQRASPKVMATFPLDSGVIEWAWIP